MLRRRLSSSRVGRRALPSRISSIILALNAGMSSGLRLVTSPWSTTTSWSTQLPPALRISVWSVGHEVSFRPLDDACLDEDPRAVADRRHRLARLEESLHERDDVLVAAELVGVADAARDHQRVVVGSVDLFDRLVDLQLVPLSKWLNPWISPGFSEIRCVSAPASSSALRGSTSSTCSTMSAAMIATLFPSSFLSCTRHLLCQSRVHTSIDGSRTSCARRGRHACVAASTPPGLLARIVDLALLSLNQSPCDDADVRSARNPRELAEPAACDDCIMMRPENLLNLLGGPNVPFQIATATTHRGEFCRVAGAFDANATLVQRSVAQEQRDVSTVAHPPELLRRQPLDGQVVAAYRRGRGRLSQRPEKLLIAVRLQRVEQACSSSLPVG